ncbi:uncharacterized protein LOC127793877 [Diospyros lotus]|uniref:uncharacterized protein LOC127793877 n=1 Tax=Diospyros lotus TaxID=55363 RepID=UPI00225363C1|nr:uncharacterized protein LOC127793877 [Diospyros lotus]
MNTSRVRSSPELVSAGASAETKPEERDDSSLEGVAATVKLLLKLIQDHKEACAKEQNDKRRMLRVAGMMTILENVRTRIQNCQSFGKNAAAGLRRCNTDLEKRNAAPRDQKKAAESIDEKEKLRKQLTASLAARKSLEVICSSLGKEKEIMVGELAKKVQELSETEELVNDLKVQNEKLLAKVRGYAGSGGGGGGGRDDLFGSAAMQERNRVLTEQVLRSLEGYKSVKRKLKELQAEKTAMREAMEELGAEVGYGLGRIRRFKEGVLKEVESGDKGGVNIEGEISKLEHTFERLHLKVSRLSA